MSRPRALLRIAAFPDGDTGGNPAGVVTEAVGMSDSEMQRVAAEVGYAETAFVVSRVASSDDAVIVRYFSPVAEVPFCGHATVATAIALAEAHGPARRVFETRAGEVEVTTSHEGGSLDAAFTSVEPWVAPLENHVLEELLLQLGLDRSDLDATHPARLAFAGNVHPVLTIAGRARFDGFSFDPGSVRSLMDEQGWRGTITVLHREGRGRYEARNLFPVGTLAEDPATGSAAASVGAYLRERGLIDPPARVVIRQGRHIGSPSLLRVEVPASGGIVVRGTARHLRV